MRSFIIFLIIIIPFNVYGENFATINFEKIFKESNAFNLFLKDIEKYKDEKLINIKKFEEKLIKEKKNLDESKLIYSDDKLNEKIFEHENNIIKFQNEIDKINGEIYNKIEEAKIFLNQKITKIIKDLSAENNYLIVFDENNYVVAIKNIDITEHVITILNKNVKKINIKKL